MNATARLATIVEEIRKRTQTISDVVEIGEFLVEAREYVEHGDWLPWLEREFLFSERTAQNYMAAYEFSLKYATVADLKLTIGALYDLASKIIPTRWSRGCWPSQRMSA